MTPTAMTPAAGDRMPYKAFVSYSHRADLIRASALHAALEQFAKPWTSRRAIRIFRDTQNLSATPHLWPDIEKALSQAEFFILIASPDAARSKWVPQEIEYWFQNRDPDKFLIVLAGGVLEWDPIAGDYDWDRTDALPASLRGVFNAEPLYVDLSWATAPEHLSPRNLRFRDAVATLAATLHGIPKDELDSADIREYRKSRGFRRLAAASLVLLTLLSLGLATVAYVRTRQAEAQRDVAIQRGLTNLSRQLAAQAVTHLDDHLDLALLLSVEANRTADTLESRQSLLLALRHSPHLIAFLRGPQASVNGIAFSPDGRTLAAGGERSIQLWDVSTRRPLGAPLMGHTEQVNCVAFSPDGTTLASGSGMDHVSGRPDDFAVGHADKAIHLWDVRTRQALGSPLVPPSQPGIVPGFSGSVENLAFSPDGGKVVCGQGEEWDVQTRRPSRRLPFVDSDPTFSPDGALAADEEDDGTVRLWDVAAGRSIGRLATIRPGVTPDASGAQSVAFSRNGRLLAVGYGDGAIQLWDVRLQRRFGGLLTTQGSTGFASMAFSPDGETLAADQGDGKMILWDVGKPQPTSTSLTGPGGGVARIAFSPDGATLASSDDQGDVLLWSVGDSGGLSTALPGPSTASPGLSNSVTCVAFSPDGALLAARSQRVVRLWDTRTWQPHGPPLACGDGRCVAFSPDGRTLAANLDELWDLPTGKATRLPGVSASGWDNSLSFSPDGAYLVSGEGCLYDIRRRQSRRMTLPDDDNYREGATFSPDGTTLALWSSDTHGAGGFDHAIHLWGTTSWSPSGSPLASKQGGVNGAAFSPDGKLLASAGSDGSVVLWDVQARTQSEAPLMGPAQDDDGVEFAGVAFSPDGKTLASCGFDQAIRLWDVPSRQPIGPPLEAQNGGVNGIADSPDGTLLASGSDDGTVRVWNLDVNLWREKARRLANRNLTPDEWKQYLPGEPYRKTSPEFP